MPRPLPPRCSVDGCGRPPIAKGLCPTHYQQVRRTGSIATARGLPRVHPPWRLPAWLVEVIRQAAELDKVEAGQWVEAKLLDALPHERLAE